MKNLNLIKRLWTDSHEKQKPQRFARYAVMLIMLLAIGVGQLWADECEYNVYAVPAKLWGNDWSEASNHIRLNICPGYSDGSPFWWTITMDWKGAYNSDGQKIYKCSLKDKECGAHGMGFIRANTSDVQQAYYEWFAEWHDWSQGTKAWEPKANYADKVYTGYYSESHHWDAYSSYAVTLVGGGYIYFDNSDNLLSNTHKYFVVGHDSYSKVYEMSALDATHTNILYVYLNNEEWKDANYCAFVSPTTTWTDGDWGSSNITGNASPHTGVMSIGYNTNNIVSGKHYLYSGTNSTLTRGAECNSADVALNLSQTIDVYVSTNRGSSWSDDASWTSGYATADRYYASAYNTVSHPATTTLSSSSTSTKAVKSSTITFTGVANTGYTFRGWNTVSTGPTGGTGTKAYTVTGATTTYAFFERNHYSITYSPEPAAHFTYNLAPTDADYNTTVNLEIVPDDGYTINDVSAVDAESNTVTVANPSTNNYSFTMPAANVTVTITVALSSVTVTYNANGGTSTPSSQTKPFHDTYGSMATATRDGYRFDGWFTDPSEGTQITSSSIVDEEDGEITLYAHWTKSELSSIALSPDYAVQDEHPTITVTPTLSISSGIGTTSICWGLYTDSECTSEVDGVTFSADPSSGANTVTFNAPNAAGTYYVKATFRAGSTCSGTELNSVKQSFTVYPTHTVTIAAKVGETTIPADEYTPTNQTVNTYRPKAVDAPTIPGYDFVDWTLGENMEKTDAELTANPIHITATADDNLTANYNYTDYVLTCPSGTGYTISGNPATVAYKATGSFTVVSAAGYTIAVTAADAESRSVSLSKNGNLYSFVQGTSAVTITVTPTEVENTITIVNGHETDGDATEVTAKVASTTASATANAAAEGMKFAYWSISDAINLVDCETTEREIVFNASQSTTITANYTKRDKVTIHFAKPYGWTTVTAMYYQDETPKTGEEVAASTFTYEGATYYTFWYYTDDTGEEGGNQSAQADWNKVVFSDGGDNALAAKTINDGYYYAKGAEEADGRTTPYAEWYMRGLLNGTNNWNSEHYARPFSVTDGTATFAFGSTKSGEQYYRIYRISTGEWFRYGSDNTDLRISFDTPMTLTKNGNSADQFTSELGAYMFSMTNLNSDAPELTVSHPADTKYRLTSVTAGANGTLTGGTGGITQLGRYMPTDISASANQGYRFKEWVTTGGVVVANPTSASTTATATADGTLTATFTNEGIVYLDLSAATNDGWENYTPHVYFYSGSYWDKDKGSGSLNILSGGHAMTRIGDTHIWYYDYSSDPGISGTRNYISFTDQGNRNGYANFNACKAIYRGDFYPEMNTFVPQNYVTATLNNNSVPYYNNGYWMKYNDAEAGYYLRVYDGKGGNLQKVIPFVTANTSARDEYKAILHVDGSASAKFELCGYDIGTVNGVSYSGTFYSNTGTINSSQSGFTWEYTHGAAKASINFNAKGDYIYTLKCGTDGKLYVDVTFPIAIGDFCVVYNGLISTKADTKSDLYSDVIPHLTVDGTRTDTISFFVTNPTGMTAALSLKEVTAINSSDGVITWGASSATFNAAAGTIITSLASDVYVFKITQTKSGASYTLTYECLGEYNGNYYVRTDCAQGGWVAYKQDDHILKPTNYDGAGFNSYFVRYVPSGNVKFCIANQYNSQLTEQKLGDHNATDDGTLYDGANTRFEYDTTTNVVSRSYIGSSAANTFLYLRDASPDRIYKTDGETQLTNDTAKFIDQENWIYMLEVKAQPNATYQLEAKIHETTQYFDGTSSAQTLIGGSGDVKQNMRLVYDFKNNHLLKAWIPGTAVSGTVAIEADVMLLRTGHGDATQLNFATADSKLTEVKNVYGVIGFNKSDITDGEKTSTQRSLYWISFPFDVKLKDIFGFGKFGEDYIIRRYNGAKRAQIGWYAETNTFWETMNPNSEEEAENTMKEYEGYMIALDKGLFNSGDSRWKADDKDISAIYLYFPSSSSTMGVLSQENKEITLKELICNDDRPLSQDAGKAEPRTHRGTDSNWRVVGTGSLHDANITFRTLEGDPTTFNFYTWAANTNSLTPTAGADADAGSPTLFKAGHAVMIQWAGKLTWKAASVPAAIAARHRSSDYQNYNVELDLNYADEMVDRTYVILQENASAEFVLNEDLYKATNSNISNIYAYAGSYDCGISRVPIENTTVPVGVIIRKNGTYTFSMPSDFSGTVTLIDTFTQTRTNLSMSDYEVTLNKGTINDRFLLEININKVTTAIDGVEGGSLKDGNAHKFIENGVMYILKDGKIYDARGNRVK